MLTAEEELFYQDLVSSKILSLAALDHLVAESEVQPGINPNGTLLDVEDELGMTVVQLIMNTSLSSSWVRVRFAGCDFTVEIQRLRADLR